MTQAIDPHASFPLADLSDMMGDASAPPAPAEPIVNTPMTVPAKGTRPAITSTGKPISGPTTGEMAQRAMTVAVTVPYEAVKEAGHMAAEAGRTIADFPADVDAGLTNAKNSFTNLAAVAARPIIDAVTGKPNQLNTLEMKSPSDVGARDTVANHVVSAVVQSIPAMVFTGPLGAAAGAKGVIPLLQNTGRLAVANFLTWDKGQGNASTALENADIHTPLTRMLAIQGDTPELMARFKTTLEMMGIEGTFVLLGKTVKAIKGARAAFESGGESAAAGSIDKSAPGLLDAAKMAQGEEGFKNATPTPPPNAPKPDLTLDPKQLTQIASRAQDLAANGATVEDVLEGHDFNFNRNTSVPETKAFLNTVGETISPAVEKARGGVQTYDYIEQTAKEMALDSTELQAAVAKNAQDMDHLASVVVASKNLLNTKAKDLIDRIAGADIRISRDPKELRKAFGDGLDEFATLYKNTKAVITGSARVTAAGNILTGEDLMQFDDPGIVRLMRGLVASGGDPEVMTKLLKRSPSGQAMAMYQDYFTAALVSGPATAMRKAGSDMIRLISHPAMMIAGGVMSGDRQTALEGLRIYGSYAPSILESIRYAGRSLRTGQAYVDALPFESMRQPAWSAGAVGLESGRVTEALAAGNYRAVAENALGNAVDGVGTTLSTLTRPLATINEFAQQMAYRSKVRAQLWGEAIQKGFANPEEFQGFVDDGMKKAFELGGQANDARAKLYMQDLTFQRSLQDFAPGRTIQKAREEWPFLKVLIPFWKTPANIINEVFSGFGATSRVWNDMRGADPAMAALAKGKLATGLTLATGAAIAAHEGWITGHGPHDPKDNEAWRAAGNEPYSVRWAAPDGTQKNIRYDMFEPVGGFLGIAADSVYLAGKVPDATYTQLVGGFALATAEHVVEKSFLAGVSDIIEGVQSSPEKFQYIANQRAAAHVPKAIQYVNTFTNDPTARQVRTMLDAIINRTPWADKLPPSYDSRGRNRVLPHGVGIQTANPLYTSHPNPDAADVEMGRLEHGVTPAAPYVGTVDLRQIKVGETDAYTRLLQLQGQVKIDGKDVNEMLNEMVKSERYKSLPANVPPKMQNPRVTMIDRIIAGYRQKSLSVLATENPVVKEAVLQDRASQRALFTGQQGTQE